MPHRASALLGLAVVIAAACSETVSPAPAVAPTFKHDPLEHPHLFVDAQQPLIDSNLTPYALYPLDTEPTVFGAFKQNLAQVFKPSADIELRYVELPVACSPGVLIRIQIRDGLPSGALLFDRTYDPARFFADGTFIAFTIYGGLALSGGDTYAMVLSSAPSGTGETTCSIISGPVGDSYIEGDAYFNNPGFTPYWLPFHTFPGPDDLPFRTIVR